MSTEIKTLSKTEWAICRELALELVKMVPFYGTVYKSSLYDLIIPSPPVNRGRNGKKDVRLFLRPGKPGKANNLIINSL